MQARTLINDTRARLGRVTLPHQASSIGMNLFLLVHVLSYGEEDEVKDLLSNFRTLLPTWGFENLVSRQMNYAVRLAEAEGDLLYEELHKLLSICDEIHGLMKLGLAVQHELQEHFEVAVRNRLRAQGREARLAAEDKATEWNRASWWYSELLDS